MSPLLLTDLHLYGSQSMPDDDVPTNIGGAIDKTKKMDFADVNGLVQGVSSAAGDTTQQVTVSYRDTTGALLTEVKTLTGLTPVAFTANMERLLKGIKNALTLGDVAVEGQTAERTGVALGGSTNTITLDAGASAVDGFFNGFVVRLTGSTGGAGQIREIIEYAGATKVATVSDYWATDPSPGSNFRVAKGFFFDKTPFEVITVRRPFFNASANAPGGGAVEYYDKGFWMNTSNGLALLGAQATEFADPSGKITFGLATTINDTGGNGAGNNRKVAPAGVTFDNAAKPMPAAGNPGQNLNAGSAIGTWFKLSLLDGDAAQKTSYTPALTGSSV